MDLDPKNGQNQTPLHFACTHGHTVCVKRLLAAGASPLIKEKLGATALELAVHQAHDDVVALIRGSGNIVGEDDPMVSGLKEWLNLIGCGEHLQQFIAAGYVLLYYIKGCILYYLVCVILTSQHVPAIVYTHYTVTKM